MTHLPEITNLSCGAHFVRADLHIHSVTGSHDVKDTTATPEAIVTTAQQEGLQIIAITDHNEISAVQPALSVADTLGILVVPAVELSTPEGHLLCYLPDIDRLQRFYHSLNIADRHTQNSRCQTSLLECLDKLQALNGFGILAHVDIASGFEVEVPGASPHKTDVICHPALLGIELKDAKSTISYTDHDPDSGRIGLGRERIKRLALGTHQCLARVLNSDAHSLKALGHNARGDRRVTRYKLNSLGFDSLRIALDDCSARVRIEDEIPPSTPFIKGIRMSGGFLDGQCIHFGPNLNCIIGGRGTGKSTTFEAIRCLTGAANGAAVIDSDVWPAQIDLLVQDQAGQLHHLTRAHSGEVENGVDAFDDPISFSVECYGQGETHRISQRAQTDPSALLEYLDRFVDVRQEIVREDQLRQELLELQEEIFKARAKVDLIPQYERDLAFSRSQLAALEKANAKEIISLQRKIEQERQTRKSIVEAGNAISKAAPHTEIRTGVTNLRTAADADTLLVGKTEFLTIASQVSVFERVVLSSEADIKAATSKLAEVVNRELKAWKAKEQDYVNQVEEKKQELESQGIRVDMAFIQKLTTDEANLSQSVSNLKSWKPHLDDLWKQRRECLRSRWEARSRIAMKRSAFGAKASEILRNAIEGLNVSLKFDESAYSPEVGKIITEVMGWRSQQVQKASILTEKLTVPELLNVISRKDYVTIQNLSTDDGVKVFLKSDAVLLVDRLSEDVTRFRIECAQVTDKPRLTVTRVLLDKGGKRIPRMRDFRQLSLGQQQSVLLAIMLSADSTAPLLIDQPEDNLDGEFIYRSVIPVLRRAKERRQVIVVTHNANIAVLGDAEQILVCRAADDQGAIVLRGSIDEPKTRETACALLEGAREAFHRRARIYGVNTSR